MLSAEIDWARSRLAVARQQREAEAAQRKQLFGWGFPAPPQTLDPAHLPAGVFTFGQAAKLPWCQYKTRGWLAAFLRQYNYPYLESGLITPAGFDRLWAEKQAARCASETARKRNARQAKKRTRQLK
jgi:hypothetical protein